MIKHVTYKIQNAIQMELFGAKKSIKIAVAWFTNELLLQPLVLKLQTGVSVEIILNDDTINKGGESSLDFTSFLEAGGILRWNTTKQLLHEKFCVIDDRIIISGSYNWTNKAEYNDEVETFYYDEQETCSFFNAQFQKLQQKYQAEEYIPIVKNITIGSQKEEEIVEVPHDFTDEYGVVYNSDKTILLKGADIESYTVIDGTKEIIEYAFAHCNSLRTISFPDSVEKIGDRCFYQCKKLENIKFPGSYRIGKEAFLGCVSIQRLELRRVSSIGDYCFKDCVNLRSVETAEPSPDCPSYY